MYDPKPTIIKVKYIGPIFYVVILAIKQSTAGTLSVSLKVLASMPETTILSWKIENIWNTLQPKLHLWRIELLKFQIDDLLSELKKGIEKANFTSR